MKELWAAFNEHFREVRALERTRCFTPMGSFLDQGVLIGHDSFTASAELSGLIPTATPDIYLIAII